MRQRVLDAHGDAWQVEGRARTGAGGGAAEIRGARLMASGIAQAKWNNADITAADVDLDAVRLWYERRDTPWGVRVPLGITLDLGTPLFVKRCLYVEPHSLLRPTAMSGVSIRRATPADFDTFVAAEVAAFGDEAGQTRRWLEPVFGREGFEHWLALREQETVAIASAVRSDDRAGPAIMLTGVASISDPPGQRSEQALAAQILEAAFADGIELGHVYPATIEPWTALGFGEVPGFQIRLCTEKKRER